MKTKTARRRNARPLFQLSELERMFLALYNTVPASVRADLGERLFAAWTNARRSAQAAQAQRFKRAQRRFRIGQLGVDTIGLVRLGGRGKSS